MEKNKGVRVQVRDEFLVPDPKWISLQEAKYLERREYFLNYIIENCWNSDECKYIVKKDVIAEINQILEEEFPFEHKEYLEAIKAGKAIEKTLSNGAILKVKYDAPKKYN